MFEYAGDAMDSNCDSFEYSVNSSLDCASFVVDDYGIKSGDPESGDVYYLVCDEMTLSTWEEATITCINGGYDGLATFKNETEFEAYYVEKAALQTSAILMGYSSYNPLSFQNTGTWGYNASTSWYDGITTGYVPNTVNIPMSLPYCSMVDFDKSTGFPSVSLYYCHDALTARVGCSKRFE